MNGEISYADFIALLDTYDIRYFEIDGTITIDYQNIEDVPEEITVYDNTGKIPASSDNVDVNNPDNHQEPVIDSGYVEVEVEVSE